MYDTNKSFLILRTVPGQVPHKPARPRSLFLFPSWKGLGYLFFMWHSLFSVHSRTASEHLTVKPLFAFFIESPWNHRRLQKLFCKEFIFKPFLPFLKHIYFILYTSASICMPPNRGICFPCHAFFICFWKVSSQQTFWNHSHLLSDAHRLRAGLGHLN